MSDKDPYSKVEHVKTLSRNLRGTITESIENTSTIKFTDDDYELLKFHGTYQGYNRDTATERKKQKLDKEWEFMVRVKLPGGRINAAQYLALDNFADDYANGTLRITSRQGIQFHNILKGELHPMISAINKALMTTLGACGDVVRNVMSSPSPVNKPVYVQIQKDAEILNDELMPTTPAYHEIWVDGEKHFSGQEKPDPLYGERWLPRKFKVALALPEDNTIDVLTNCIGLIAVIEDEQIIGYNMYLGGGLGMTHNKPETYPRLASPITYVPRSDLIDAVKAVVKLQRDNGDRSNRKHARLKYVVEEQGVEWTKRTLDHYFGRELEDVRPIPDLEVADHMGWHIQDAEKDTWYLGLHVSSGRVKDDGDIKLRSALRQIAETLGIYYVLMPTEDILICDVQADQKDVIESILKEYSVPHSKDVPVIEKWGMSCVALPTCGKALAEGERARKPIFDSILKVLEKHNLDKELISVRITGCPNGCSRPYVGDIGIVGRTPDHYALFVGGSFVGTRLSYKVEDRIHIDKIAETLEPLFIEYKDHKNHNEKFGDFCDRIGKDRVFDLLEKKEAA